MAYDETQNENYIDVNFTNVDISSGATIYAGTTKRVNVSGFVSVEEGQTRKVNLNVWSLNANLVKGQLAALKIK